MANCALSFWASSPFWCWKSDDEEAVDEAAGAGAPKIGAMKKAEMARKKVSRAIGSLT